ncbi:helix-turn-helix domain-containing protein [Halomonas sp. IOP_14]|nr:helix-turn-helix domain-containing protein [Halomonas sp. IOP_14]QNU65233.1 helix-turn-helix domain-containing protein [Halomonas titanicae]
MQNQSRPTGGRAWGHRVAEVAARLGVSDHSLYHLIKRYDRPVELRKKR